MSEKTTETAEAQPLAVKKKKRTIGFRHKMALLQVLERKRIQDKVDYKSISKRTGVSVLYLRHLYVDWKRGEIDLGEPETPEEIQLDARMQHEQTINFLKRYQAVLLTGMEANILICEDEMTRGKHGSLRKSDMAWIMNELRKTLMMRKLTEEGYSTILEEAARRRERDMKSLGIPVDTETKIIQANEEERAIELLKRAREAQVAPPVEADFSDDANEDEPDEPEEYRPEGDLPADEDLEVNG